MAKGDGDGAGDAIRLTEPEPLPSLFVTGFNIQAVEENIVRLLFWTDLPPVGAQEREARLQARIFMSAKVFGSFVSEGRKIGRNKQ